MKISVTEKAAIFDMLCGTKHVFFVVGSLLGKNECHVQGKLC